RRLRAEGVRQQDAERRALARSGYPGHMDRGVEVLAAVARAYDDEDQAAQADKLLALFLRRL
ncbi:MAG TPA: hypothetical protein VMS17_17725, partial [Gemmataceae bacterium]|nr:hypothetical protein [Gemmataceae bacterium]